MECLDDATALGFARGEIAPGSVDAVIEHIASCEACRMLVAAASSLSAAPSRVATTADPGSLPARIGRFRIEGMAGHGAMGIVYRGRDERLDRPVALKVIHPQLLGSDAHGRLEREARALAKVDHPAVVGVYEVGDVDGSLFVAMEYVDGGTLEEWLAAEPRAARDILARFIQGGEGLLAAHQAGLVHRDFKPTNAMLDERGDIHVTDFGLVSDGGPEVEVHAGASGNLALTQTGAVIGTPAYMAPEQLEAKPADPRSDQFSFCVALFEALAGHRPFEARTYAELRAVVLAGRPAPPRQPIDARVHRALLRGLARKPQDRFPSMRELLDELARPRPRWWLAWLAAGVVVTLGVVIGTIWARDPPPPAREASSSTPSEASARAPSQPPQQPVVDADACAPLVARWDTVWTDERKASLRAFEISKWPESAPPGAHPEVVEKWAGLGRVDASFSTDAVRRLGDTWRSLVRETCSDDAGSPDSSSAKLRRACLADALARVDALLLDPPATGHFRDALGPVDAQLARCSTHLVESLSLPEGEAEARVNEARAMLASANAARWDRDYEQARALSEQAIALGQGAGDPPVLAEAWLELGLAQAGLGSDTDPESAIESLHEAVAFAQQSMHHRVLREGAEALAWQYLFTANDPRQARRWLDTAERLDGRVAPTQDELGRRQLIRARLARLDGDPAGALDILHAVHETKLAPPMVIALLDEWVVTLDEHTPEAAQALLDDFARRYRLDPMVLEAVSAHRARLGIERKEK